MSNNELPPTVTGPGQDRLRQLEAKLQVYEERFISMENGSKTLLSNIDKLRNENRAAKAEKKELLRHCRTLRSEGRKLAELLHMIALSGVVPHALIEQVLEPHVNPQTPDNVDDGEDENG